MPLISPIKTAGISTVVLWVCMMITSGIFVFFFHQLTDNQETTISGVSWVLNWIYWLLGTCLLWVFVSSVCHFIRKGPTEKKKVGYSFISVCIFLSLLGGSYLSGSGTPLEISGYEGNENTYQWLKVIDMWLYSIYILLILTFSAVIVGIVWSYIKKSG
jgi:hypothetical protein